MRRSLLYASVLAWCAGCSAILPLGPEYRFADDGEGDAGRVDGGSVSDGGMDAGAEPEGDASAPPSDAAPPSSDAAEGAPCAFNRECGAEQRCECDEATGCFCAAGPRGTGELGDPCVDGNDCASSVCIESSDGSYCSEECVTDTDCAAPLPRCLDVTFVGRICVPPEGG